jgi:hypothetical protein
MRGSLVLGTCGATPTTQGTVCTGGLEGCPPQMVHPTTSCHRENMVWRLVEASYRQFTIELSFARARDLRSNLGSGFVPA